MFQGFQTVGVDLIERRIARLSLEAPTKAARALYTSALAIFVPAMKKRVRDNRSIFRGELFQKITAKAVITAGIPAVDVGAIGVPHGLAVEFGQEPGTRQDLRKLIEYARLKMGLPVKKASRMGQRLKKSIELRGTKPHPFISPVVTAEALVLTGDFIFRFRKMMGL